MKTVRVNRFVSAVAALALIVGTGGCATVYQKSEFSGMDGYSSKVISDDTVEIQYMVSQPWNFSKVLNFSLYRAAEMATERGYFSFKLLVLKEYSVGTSKIAKCTVQFIDPPAAERILPETADQLATYDLVGLGVFKPGDAFVASELKRMIDVKLIDVKK
ncbi:CC0125/CC1285 family lipoprotein [Undibacterium flavidum]|uniref:DUF4136 domain-containing protein n=1 Tax=Undibacterium flavidum TaxID=2762297 RepID=A0ABR6YAQ5_9BURK|nr:hypothetical protein [Undibacterium flavidum]MBC3873676.1 hypothetical protein [Undibacterium flavidum]